VEGLVDVLQQVDDRVRLRHDAGLLVGLGLEPRDLAQDLGLLDPVGDTRVEEVDEAVGSAHHVVDEDRGLPSRHVLREVVQKVRIHPDPGHAEDREDEDAAGNGEDRLPVADVEARHARDRVREQLASLGTHLLTFGGLALYCPLP
jgi:hypothetical protein